MWCCLTLLACALCMCVNTYLFIAKVTPQQLVITFRWEVSIDTSLACYIRGSVLWERSSHRARGGFENNCDYPLPGRGGTLYFFAPFAQLPTWLALLSHTHYVHCQGSTISPPYSFMSELGGFLGKKVQHHPIDINTEIQILILISIEIRKLSLGTRASAKQVKSNLRTKLAYTQAELTFLLLTAANTHIEY